MRSNRMYPALWMLQKHSGAIPNGFEKLSLIFCCHSRGNTTDQGSNSRTKHIENDIIRFYAAQRVSILQCLDPYA